MNAVNTAQPLASPNSGKMLRAMVGIGVICALMIVLTFEGTAPVIKENRAEALEKAIFRVLPGMAGKKTFRLEGDQFVEVSGENKGTQPLYAGYDQDGKLVGIVIEASGLGFADILRILYGYDPVRQKVVGFYVLESKETPGLGDKIEKAPHFLANFLALDVELNSGASDLKNKVITVKQGTKKNPWEIDGITGATISSRAIGNIIDASARHWAPLIQKNQEVFMQSDKENGKNQ